MPGYLVMQWGGDWAYMIEVLYQRLDSGKPMITERRVIG